LFTDGGEDGEFVRSFGAAFDCRQREKHHRFVESGDLQIIREIAAAPACTRYYISWIYGQMGLLDGLPATNPSNLR